MTDLSPLFQPFRLGPVTLRNRFVMAPMTRMASPGGVPGADVAAYYRRRTTGGVGLIITEGTTIDHPVASAHADIPQFHGGALHGWMDVVEAVHEAGGAIMPQLWHLGMQRFAKHAPNPELPSVGPSGLFAPGKKVSEPMTESEIADVIDAFARGADAALTLGFDGAELHGAHGYLIDQFFWSGTNARSDKWGGDLVGRTRFATEIIKSARRAVGPHFPLILRWSQWKGDNYTARLVDSPGELERFLAPMVDAGISAVHCSTRRFWEPGFPESGSELTLAAWTKNLSGLPTITVGSIGLSKADTRDNRQETIDISIEKLGLLAQMIARGDVDLAAVGRALLANPAWADLVREERFDALVPYSAAAVNELV